MLQTCYGQIQPLRVVGNAVRPLPAAERRRPIVLAAARWWDEGKNAALLDEAAASMEWPVYAAGPLRGPDSQQAHFSHTAALGAVPHGEVRRLMARAGIFVSPSIYEPFGLAALEAAAAGTPLVLTDIPTYREIWDGAACFFGPRDARGLADCVGHLSRDEGERLRLGRAAARRARNFLHARQAAAMREVYDECALVAAER
jgi:glycosyltransferase involved in cell wall biosynthesis